MMTAIPKSANEIITRTGTSTCSLEIAVVRKA